VDLPPIQEPHVGISHSVKFDNKYFNATLPIWIDEFTDELLKEANVDPSNNELTASQLWTDAFCSDEEDVKMVRDSILAVVYTFDPSRNPDDLEKGPAKDLKKYFAGQVASVLQFVDKLDEDGWDGIMLAVAKKKLTADSKPIKHSAERTSVINHVTELFSDYGIDVLDMVDSGVSSDGDRLGIAGLKDKLETHIALSGNFEADIATETEEKQAAANSANDALSSAIDKILDNDPQAKRAFDEKELDKALADSGFAFPLLEGYSLASQADRDGETFDPNSLEDLVNKIREARRKY
jgi:hypothetical protein